MQTRLAQLSLQCSCVPSLRTNPTAFANILNNKHTKKHSQISSQTEAWAVTTPSTLQAKLTTELQCFVILILLHCCRISRVCGSYSLKFKPTRPPPHPLQKQKSNGDATKRLSRYVSCNISGLRQLDKHKRRLCPLPPPDNKLRSINHGASASRCTLRMRSTDVSLPPAALFWEV